MKQYKHVAFLIKDFDGKTKMYQSTTNPYCVNKMYSLDNKYWASKLTKIVKINKIKK